MYVYVLVRVCVCPWVCMWVCVRVGMHVCLCACMRTVITTFQFVCVHVYCENVMANISDEKTKIKKSKKLVQWTADMDNTLCIQILAEQPYQYKKAKLDVVNFVV